MGPDDGEAGGEKLSKSQMKKLAKKAEKAAKRGGDAGPVQRGQGAAKARRAAPGSLRPPRLPCPP